VVVQLQLEERRKDLVKLIKKKAEDGKVAMVEKSVEATTGMVTVRGIMNNESETLWPGILVNTKLVSEADRPKGINDLTNPKWKGKIGLAKPLFGTTATHAACLFAAWGDHGRDDLP